MSAASTKVVVGLSGGVDSAVSAALLVEQGYEVIGMMLRLWSEPGCEDANRCCAPEAMQLARQVASQLDIPFYILDARQVHYQHVVGSFIDGYSRGLTPNPCLACNQEVRWGFMLQHALHLGASHLATGHYARILRDPGGSCQVLKGLDPQKDQSYVLHMLDQDKLSRTILPVGSLTKQQVRQIARERQLPVSERSDSQDLCFLGGGDYRSFLSRYAPQANRPGSIVNTRGEIVGQHSGLANYTIGQRKGLNLSGGIPHYVLAKDNEHNILVIGVQEEMGTSRLTAVRISWISGSPPAAAFRAAVKTRYTAAAASAEVRPFASKDTGFGFSAEVVFDQPQRDITPGQAAVFYCGEICLGGGRILSEQMDHLSMQGRH